jgi:hypothetical protein
MSKLYENLARVINESSMTEGEKQKALKSLLESQNAKPNVLITGATGCGKSSTINALFNAEKAKVGTGSTPETMQIAKYELGNLTLWDSPGLGDGVEEDKQHSKGIIDLLTQKDENGKLLIDVVLVILDGSSRDMGTSYELINKVIAPCLGEGKNKRLLIGINQADLAMKGRYWDSENHKPEPQLETFLKDKEKSVHDRILDGTGISVQPISYSAGFKEEGEPQEPAYNLSKLLYYIIDNIPSEKRLNVLDNMNTNREVWQSDDGLEEYRDKTIEASVGGIFGSIKECADIGREIGKNFGPLGEAAGTVIGGAVGVFKGIWESIFG